jgi:hypothetical protein
MRAAYVRQLTTKKTIRRMNGGLWWNCDASVKEGPAK